MMPNLSIVSCDKLIENNLAIYLCMEFITMHRYFFRTKRRVEVGEEKNDECCIQVPSAEDLEQMHGMPAGADEDQFTRLKNMTQVISAIKSTDTSLAVQTTNKVTLPKCWTQLFTRMKQGNLRDSLAMLAQFPKQDVIFQAVLSVHTLEYVQQLIKYCIQAQKNGSKRLNSDILITPGVFEVLIKDLAMSLFYPGKVQFSFGLPTHHAFGGEGSGFCILNKTAILLKYLQNKAVNKFIIVGTDVNRDNGLCDILMRSAAKMDICHVDVFDSRVYPAQDNSFIESTFKTSGQDVGQKIHLWQKENFQYYAVDLSATKRQSSAIHPALIFAIDKIKEQIESAKANQQKIALFLPTGWDSHEEETAYCGKWVDGQLMQAAEAQVTRFNASDLTYFYENIFRLYQENKDNIERVYWGLEGGYDRNMYEQQIRCLMSLVLKNIVHSEKSVIEENYKKPKSGGC